MLKLAIQSRLPLIAATTTDALNLKSVISELTGFNITQHKTGMTIEAGKVYFKCVKPGSLYDWYAFYNEMAKHGSTLLVINPKRIEEPMYNAGEVPVPRKLLLRFIANTLKDKQLAETLIPALGGCTLKNAAEFIRLTVERDGEVTSHGLTETRRSSFQGANGLTYVSTSQPFYQPDQALQDWIETERDFFFNAPDPRLMPKGLLFDGLPGCGKSAGAKYIAEQWGIPLFRVDVGATKNKYVGQSEENMLSNLSRLDHEEPCVALFDEVEKIFTRHTSDNSGATATMLSQLLWWLAERKSKVLVVMTTNKAKILPPELYRDGRIDQTMFFGGIEKSQAPDFIRNVLSTFNINHVDETAIDWMLKQSHELEGERHSQAALTNAAIVAIKQGIVSFENAKELAAINCRSKIQV